MKRKAFLIFIIILFTASCERGNRSQEVIETVIHPSILSDIDNMIEDTAISYEPVDVIVNSIDSYEASEPEVIFNILDRDGYREAIINADCDYYIGGKAVGRLSQGQRVIILDHYSPFVFNIHVEIMTVEGTITGYVDENNITYLGDNLRHDLWFKNILLTREYYYTGTVEDIFTNSGYGSGNNIERSLRLWRSFYSEERMRITDNYLIHGDNETIVAYRLESIKKDENTFTINLSNMLNDEYEVTLVDYGYGIAITNYIVKSNDFILNTIPNILNFKYIPYDEEKSEITRNAVIAWIDEQLALLTGNIS